MKISIVIIHWNSVELLEMQLAALGKLNQIEVVVVDNASTQSLGSLQKKYPKVLFIKNDINRGFAYGCNQGVRATKGEWILFLNPDVGMKLLQLKKFVEFAESHKLAAASPLFENEDYRKPIPTLLTVLIEFTPLVRILPLSDLGTKTLVGGCLLIKREILKKISGWDERFFLWFEDSDVSKKLATADFEYGFYADSKITHIGGASFSQMDLQLKRDIFFHSLIVFSDKHLSRFSRTVIKKISSRYTKKRLLAADDSLTSSIVVPNIKHNLLKSFLKENYKYFDFKSQELIIVTSSADYEELRSTFPQVIFIYQRKNKGFAHTVNIGFQRARGKFIGTVNDDVILNKGWLHKLEEHFSRSKKVGSLSPLIEKLNGEVESLGVNVLPFGRANVQRSVKDEIQTDVFNAAAVLFSREALEEVGLFDELFQSYLEDIDLGLRLKRAGWKNIAVGNVRIRHLGQQTSKTMGSYKEWLDVRNWWLVMIKNFGPSHWYKNFLPILMERARNLSGYFKSLDNT